MSSMGFELTISAVERPQTYALDRSATETGKVITNKYKYNINTLLRGLSYYYDY
jgi:hypothetical protein